MGKGSGTTRTGSKSNPKGLTQINNIGVSFRADDIERAFFVSGTTKIGDYTIVTNSSVEQVPNSEQRGLTLTSGIDYRIYDANGKMVSFGMANDTNKKTIQQYRELIRKDIKKFNLKKQ